MDKNDTEEDVIGIDLIDPVGDDDVAFISPEGTGDGSGNNYPPIEVSNNNIIKTGNIISHFFNLIAQAKDNDLWKLDDKEIKSLNNTCPKILPEIIQQHSGLIGCILSLIGIVIKRIKLEQSLTEDTMIQPLIEESKNTGLTGGRTS